MRIKDPVSGGLHLAAAVLSVAGLFLLLRQAGHYEGTRYIIAYSIFGVSLVTLYLASAVHHLIPKNRRHAKLFRKIDHAMIFVLIAGTYTPVCLITLGGVSGSSLLAVLWMLAIAGVTLKISGAHVSRRVSTAIYVAMGWSAVAMIVPIFRELTLAGFLWMLAGGIFYTIGAIIYAYRIPDPVPKLFGFHEIFHLFVMAGSLAHFWMVFRYVR